MTITVEVTLRCDGRRESCEISYPLGPDPEPAAVTARWRHAHDLGWSKYPPPGGRPTLHLCPTCNAHRLAGALVTEAQRTAAAPPPQGWPAAPDDWQRRQAARQEEERRQAEAQRAPGESYAWPPGWQEQARRRVVWGT